MRLLSISLRNLRIRLVGTTLTTIAIVVATALYASIQVMAEQTEQRYKGSVGGYQAVIGPKDSSQLELVLNTIFNVGEAPGRLPLSICDELRSGKGLGRRSQVRYAIPQARGDSVSSHSFPVIATIDEMFSKYEWNQAPLSFAAGGPFQHSYADLQQLAAELAAYESARRTGETVLPPRPRIRPAWQQAVVGARVARTLGLEVGGSITPVHGKRGEFGFHEHPEATCAVVGVLAPTNSPLDTTIFLPIGLHFLIDGHEGGVFLVEVPPGKNPDDAKNLPVKADRLALTAVLADPKDHFGARLLRDEFGSKEAQVAWPQDVVPKFLRQIGNAADALTVIAWLVLLVAAVSITVAIYNTMNERRREIAIMRSLGARRFQILTIIVGEAALLSCVGAVLGVLVCHLAAFFMRGYVEDRTGVYLDWLVVRPWELWLIGGVTMLGAFAGLLPAVKGSVTQVADNLAANY
ncbi:MAG: ABC transporter permease [Planctomycetes bacterium]|nr:ABC transporter permease [Planctomycetota bacterium]MCC7397299.1 ABC transporter permease [Planctomycetota bacterium]